MRGSVRRFTIITALAGLAWLLACSDGGPGDVTGAGSKSSNAFVGGTVSNPIGDKAGVAVTLYKIDVLTHGYNWYAADSTLSDSNGTFAFDSVDAGEYSLVLAQGNARAFSGYFEIQEDQTRLCLDSLQLTAPVSVMGMLSYSGIGSVGTSLVGTADQVVIPVDTMSVDTRRYFVFDHIPAGDYRMLVELNHATAAETTVYVPLPTGMVTDTTYADTSFGVVNTVTVKDRTIEIINRCFRLVCFVAVN
jgi:hypothetical protein